MQSELAKAARDFMFLFIVDGGDRGISLDDIDPMEFSQKFAALEVALSTDAEPVIYVSRKSLDELLEAQGSHVALQTLIHRKPLKSGNGVPLYAEPAKTAPAVAVSREEMAERLFATDWPNDKWDRFKDGDHAKERYLRMADTALSAQVQDVAWWQPIDTADKKQILLLWNGKRVYEGYWGTTSYNRSTKEYEQGWVSHPSSGDTKPSHWMPLPASPVAKHGGP